MTATPPGYAQKDGNVPEAEWLLGNPVGYRGPWGTTYASNLRLFVPAMKEDEWVKETHKRNSKPPMAWPSMHAMSEQDLRAVYKYIISLGKKGEQAPEDVPPNEEPKGKYVVLTPTGGGK